MKILVAISIILVIALLIRVAFKSLKKSDKSDSIAPAMPKKKHAPNAQE